MWGEKSSLELLRCIRCICCIHSVHRLCFSTRGQCTTICAAHLPTTVPRSVPNFSKGFFAQIRHVYLASQQKSKCQIEEEIRSENARRQSVYLQAFAHSPTVGTAHVRLSPAEQLGYGGVGGHDNWGAVHTT